MSAFGGDMTVGLRLTAKDETQGAVRAASSGFSRFRSLVSKPITVPLRIAGGGLALLRDINLGLRPVLAGLDRMIERGAALETQQKAFGRFTQLSARDSAGFARSLQQSALWTLRLGEALTIANRAMTTNIPREALDDLFKFSARRAAATGETTAGIIGGLVSGLGIGSARALKQFGLDIEHVADSYERIHGAGAFDELPFAARQAMILKAAMGEMRREVQLLKFSGREAIFSWQAIKTHVGDMTDKLFAAVARSDAMRTALVGVRDLLSGITRHFEKGGSFGELLFGKEGGKSGGLLGGVGALFKDLGGFIGEGLRSGLGGLGDLRIEGLAELTSKIGSLAGEMRQAIIDGLASVLGTGRLGEFLFGTADKPGPAEKAFRMAETAQQLGPGGVARALWAGVNAANAGLLRRIFSAQRQTQVPVNAGLPTGAGLGFGFGLGGSGASGFSPFGHWRQWSSDFHEDYSGSVPRAESYLRDAPGQYALTPVARRSLMRQAAVMRWRMRQVEQGNFGVRQRALRSAGEEIAGLRRAGYAIGPRQEREIRDRHLSGERDKLMDGERGLQANYERIKTQISMSDRRRAVDAHDSVTRRGGREDGDADRRAQRTADAAARIAEQVEQLVAQAQALMGALVGGRAQMAKAR